MWGTTTVFPVSTFVSTFVKYWKNVDQQSFSDKFGSSLKFFNDALGETLLDMVQPRSAGGLAGLALRVTCVRAPDLAVR